MLRTCSSLVTSAGKLAASPPAAWICAAAVSSIARSRDTSATRAPSAPSATAIACPSPLLAPVITALLPASLPLIRPRLRVANDPEWRPRGPADCPRQGSSGGWLHRRSQSKDFPHSTAAAKNARLPLRPGFFEE